MDNYMGNARVMLLAQADCKQAYDMTVELNLVGIAVRKESLQAEAGKRLAVELGIRYVALIGDREEGQVQLMDIVEQQEGSMPMVRAIYIIEKVYPPEDFT